jgi:antitoxin component YwqK of YwqJK toxin-antitoxin module
MERQAFWKKGKMEGKIEEWYEDGSVAFEGSFVDNKPRGAHKSFYEKGIASEEFFTKEGREGEQKAYFPNGQLKMVCCYKNGQLDGAKKISTEDGALIFNATYKQGMLEGKVVYVHPDGMKEIRHFTHNHPDGLWQIYYPECKIKALEATFVNGLLEGGFSEFDEVGTKVVSIPYKSGKREGTAINYDHDGHVVMSAEYVEGLQEGPMKYYYPSGALYKEAIFHADLQEGEELCYFENGSVSGRSFFLHGKLHGLVQNWNEQGVLIFEAEYQEGLRSGKFNKYYDDGSPRLLQRFENDVLVHNDKKVRVTTCAMREKREA